MLQNKKYTTGKCFVFNNKKNINDSERKMLINADLSDLLIVL